MDNTGQQLHPNWRALSTVHIPIKRFIKEGTHQTEQGTHQANQDKYEIKGIKPQEIKEFYEELINKQETSTSNLIEKKLEPKCKKISKPKTQPPKEIFEVKNYFRYSMENKVELLKLINFQQQDINICDGYGWSALMMAACEGAYEAVEFLLTLGVERNLKDKKGMTAKDLAQKKGHLIIVDLLNTSITDEGKEFLEIDESLLEETSFYCQICQRNFTETSQRQHQTSTVHQFNLKSSLPANKLQKFNIPPRNRGLQLMVKQGWNKESGLGPSQTGRLYPVKTVIRKQRTGLGIEQQSARVTHFEAFDLKAVQRPNSDYYRKKPRNSNDIKREKVREWKRDRRLRNELN